MSELLIDRDSTLRLCDGVLCAGQRQWPNYYFTAPDGGICVECFYAMTEATERPRRVAIDPTTPVRPAVVLRPRPNPRPLQRRRANSDPLQS